MSGAAARTGNLGKIRKRMYEKEGRCVGKNNYTCNT